MPREEIASVILLQRWKDSSDQAAAEELYGRYSNRLIALARTRLPGRFNRRVDPHDVVQSVCRTFFKRVSDGVLEVRPDGNLWDLLATITMRKLFGQVDHHQAAKRNVARETEPAKDGSISVRIDGMDREPSPDDAAALREELDLVLGQMEPHHREMVQLSLLEYTPREIGETLKYSERQVRNVLNDFRDRLRQRL